jgi:hypothetical protein
MAGQNQKPSGKRRGKRTKHTTANVDDMTDDAAPRPNSRDLRAVLDAIRERDAKLYRALLVVIGHAGTARHILPALSVIVDFAINQARREAFGLDASLGASTERRRERSGGAR